MAYARIVATLLRIRIMMMDLKTTLQTGRLAPPNLTMQLMEIDLMAFFLLGLLALVRDDVLIAGVMGR